MPPLLYRNVTDLFLTILAFRVEQAPKILTTYYSGIK